MQINSAIRIWAIDNVTSYYCVVVYATYLYLSFILPWWLLTVGFQITAGNLRCAERTSLGSFTSVARYSLPGRSELAVKEPNCVRSAAGCGSRGMEFIPNWNAQKYVVRVSSWRTIYVASCITPLLWQPTNSVRMQVWSPWPFNFS